MCIRDRTKGKGEFILTGIFLDNPFPGLTVTGIGVNGASLGSYAKCPDLLNDLSLVNPDLVIFAVGINDAVSYTHLLSSRRAFRSRNSTATPQHSAP